jgi:hypothetical protein
LAEAAQTKKQTIIGVDEIVSLKEKSKSLQEWKDEVTYVRQGKVLVPENPEQVKQRLVKLEDAEALLQQIATILKRMPWVAEKQCREIEALLNEAKS